MHIGKTIDAVLAAAGLQQQQLADILGITPEHLSRTRNGRRSMSGPLYALLLLLGSDPGLLRRLQSLQERDQ